VTPFFETNFAGERKSYKKFPVLV